MSSRTNFSTLSKAVQLELNKHPLRSRERLMTGSFNNRVQTHGPNFKKDNIHKINSHRQRSNRDSFCDKN